MFNSLPFKPKKQKQLQRRTLSALDATAFNKLPKIKAGRFLDILLFKKLKLKKKEKQVKSKKAKAPSAFKVNYLHWLKNKKNKSSKKY